MVRDSGEGTVTGRESSMIRLWYTFQIISPFFVELTQKEMQEVAEIEMSILSWVLKQQF